MSEADAVDVHAVAQFLFAQLYIRQVQRPEAMEVWPTANSTGVPGAEAAAAFGGSPSSSSHTHSETFTPASPARSNSSNSSQGSGRQHLHQGGELLARIAGLLRTQMYVGELEGAIGFSLTCLSDAILSASNDVPTNKVFRSCC